MDDTSESTRSSACLRVKLSCSGGQKTRSLLFACYHDARALDQRLQEDHVSRTLVLAFHRFLQAPDSERQIAYKEREISTAL
ncbi:hypothetical protein BGW80DRAFT_1380228 [Lactifluus volemus]|nr:hypothetical protein BGW80DRAFT_1380228 [Lactifluus volemus]